MITLDQQFLNTVSLGDLSGRAAQRTLQTVQTTLVCRFCSRLVREMTDSEFAEYDTFVEAGDRDGACHWIKANIPQYKLLLAVELAQLKAQVTQDAPAIFAIETALDDCADFYEPRFAALSHDLPIDLDQEGL